MAWWPCLAMSLLLSCLFWPCLCVSISMCQWYTNDSHVRLPQDYLHNQDSDRILCTKWFFFLVFFCYFSIMISCERLNNNHFAALCPGLPGWAGTRRNTHPPTILIIQSERLSWWQIMGLLISFLMLTVFIVWYLCVKIDCSHILSEIIVRILP